MNRTVTKDALAAIVLAAGCSRRAGPHLNKLTSEFAGQPLVCHAIDAMLDAGCDPVVLVTGHEAEEIRAAVTRSDGALHLVHNDRHTEGMGASIRSGAKALMALGVRAAGVFVLPGDMPRIRAQHVRELEAAFPRDDLEAICVPTRAGRRGHPVLFGAAHLPALRRLTGDRGARGILETQAAHVIEVPLDTPAIHFDVDRPEDAELDDEAGNPGKLP